jgi:AraC-like DNA-binding protein
MNMVNQDPTLDTLNAVQRMQDFIESHLQRPITLKELANAAGYSPFHASRLPYCCAMAINRSSW